MRNQHGKVAEILILGLAMRPSRWQEPWSQIQWPGKPLLRSGSLAQSSPLRRGIGDADVSALGFGTKQI